MLEPYDYAQKATSDTPKIQPELIQALALNNILRGALTAVDSYTQVIEKVKDDPESVRLTKFKQFHEDLVSYWELRVGSKNIEPAESPGVWGFVVTAFVGVAKILGSESALSALIMGEEHGLNEYKRLLENKFTSSEDKKFIRDTIIPRLDSHIASIEAMKKNN